MLKRTKERAGQVVRLRRAWRDAAMSWYETLNHEYRQEMLRVEALIINREGGNFTPLDLEKQDRPFKLRLKYEVLRSQELNEATEKTLRNTIKLILKLEATRGRSV